MVKIEDISTYIPPRKISNEMLFSNVNLSGQPMDPLLLEKIFGIKERRFAHKDEQASDLAFRAALPIVEKVGKKNIDYMIFAAACSDLIEPATCNIVHKKLGLSCPAMDVKNACNSVVSAIHTASAFINAGMYKRILITCGEKLSDAITYDVQSNEHLKRIISSYTLGDGGVALLITASNDHSGIFHQEFLTAGKYWELCTIKGGGSMNPHDVSKNYFESDSTQLREVLVSISRDFIQSSIKKAGWALEDIDHLITHQVSMHTFEVICNEVGLDQNKCISIFEHCGNMASASIPSALHHGVTSGTIKKGDKVAILGFAAGVSASVQLMKW